MGQLKQRIPATTLVETMAAMVIIMLSFGLGLMIYMNVISSDRLGSISKANLLLQEYLEDSKNNSTFYDEEFTQDGITIKKTAAKYGQHGDTFLLHLTAEDPDEKLIYELREIVYVPRSKE